MSKRLTIEEMQRLAEEKGGRCLSEEYVNNRTKLLWQCAEGHKWETTFGSIKNGHWCPICAGNTKKTIVDMHDLASKRGGKCLSDIYVNSNTKIKWECSEGHRWEATPASVQTGRWCKRCAGLEKKTIQDMQKLAEEQGGKCLSTVYKNNRTKLEWMCSDGHIWKAEPSSIQQGKWCKICAGSQKKTIEDMKFLARKQGGKCLSNEYINSKTKLKWECAEGHRWKAAPSDIQQGKWCKKCYGNERKTIEHAKKLAHDHGGKCLSSEYVNSKSNLLWECSKGHQWEATWNSVSRGTWCPVCGGSQRLNLDEMHEIAKDRGGKCLSDEYVNVSTKLKWECSQGHQWSAEPKSIKVGRWCPECSAGLGERICREFFQQIFGKRFPKSYPNWLRNSENNQLELDGYCKSLGIAFEHQGEQHYNLSTHFVNSQKDLEKLQTHDDLKKQICTNRGIKLIIVPEIPGLLPLSEVKAFLKNEFNKQDVVTPGNFDSKEIDLANAYKVEGGREKLEYLKKLAAKNGGKCLSDTYIDGKTHLVWECSAGHQWKATPNNIERGNWCRECYLKSVKYTIDDMRKIAAQRGGKSLSNHYSNKRIKLLWECSEGHQWKAEPGEIIRGSWCPYCAGKAPITIEDMQAIARERGGKCLSKEVISSKKLLKWECSNGHQWLATPSNIKKGTWCRKCHVDKRKLTIEDMNELAQSRNGKCLSTVYKNAMTNLLWECSEGHQWEAVPSSIKRGSWCPICAGSQKKTIEDMKLLASSRGGICLSNEYVNNATKLLWECSEGHQWEAMPKDIKRGHWCPICARSKRKKPVN